MEAKGLRHNNNRIGPKTAPAEGAPLLGNDHRVLVQHRIMLPDVIDKIVELYANAAIQDL
eukprot:565224-Lingulodinium_polyedra.AAC.1